MAAHTKTSGVRQGTTGATESSDLGGRTSVVRLAAVAIELGLIFLVVRAYLYDQKTFRDILSLACVGFLIHHFLPTRFRLPFFVCLSITGVYAVLGPGNTTWVIALGMLLIGACHLPIQFGWRLTLIVGIAGLLVALRAEWVANPIPAVVWATLGSMFMFRLIVYLYDLRTNAAPFGFWRSTAYFFMLPNACFPLFPVVDYKTFCRTRYNEDPTNIYQTGVRWIFRGVVHLLLYRFVYLVLQVNPGDIDSPAMIFQWMVSTFLLYLRVSGQFHIIVGVLHLFGFNLPETNHLYLLSSSFTDFWRRINIYWRDFMMKVFFYPLRFRLKRFGSEKALVLATVVTFIVTWLLHSYQTFWLMGSFPISAQDIVFWGVLGLLVTANVMYDFHFRKSKTRKKTASRLRGVAAVVGTFLTIVSLWSIWSAESLSEWLQVVRQAGDASAADLAKIGSVLILLAGGALLLGRPKLESARTQSMDFWRSVGATLAVASLVFIVSRPMVQSILDPQTRTILASIRHPRLNARDAENIERGYYEDLVHVDRAGQLRLHGRGEVASVDHEVPTGDYRLTELLPSTSTTFMDQPFSTNRWGMRDRDYELVSPEGTYRIALLGSSQAMGWGVADDQTFENIVEDRLNLENDGSRYQRFEILNFSMNGYDPVSKLMVLENKTAAFEVDAVLYVSHSWELEWIPNRLARNIRTRVEIPYEYLRDVAERANVKPSMSEVLIKGRLTEYAPEIVAWVYGRVVEISRDRGAEPLWVYLPDTRGRGAATLEQLLPLAKAAGFVTIDLSAAFTDVSSDSLARSEVDPHPNPRAHELLARELYSALRRSGGPFSLRAAAAARTASD